MSAADSEQISEALLEESTEELYENGPCGFLQMLPNGSIVKVNRTFLRWTGYRAEHLMNRKFQDFLSIPGKIFYDTHYAPLLRMQNFANELAFDIVRPDGTLLPILMNSTLRRSDDGEPRLILAAAFNATDRRRYEQELLRARNAAERASKIKADLLAMISHDIRTPVSAIVTALQLLERIESSPQQQRALNIMHSSSRNLLNMLNEVLDFSKIESGTVSLEERPFNLHKLLDTLHLTLLPQAEDKAIELKLRIAPSVPAEVVGDEIKIGQILSNLITNAIKFTPQGEVQLAADVKASTETSVQLVFTVEDTGIGIAKERLAYIFDEFTQADEGTARQFGGTGLGLAIVKRLLALYDSEMQVTSEPGVGSSFSFELNLSRSLPDHA